MIASPSDVSQERQIVRDIVSEWNAIHAKDRKTVLMAIGWETHSTPDVGDRPQSIINGQLLKDADLLVAAFWTRIGTPTGLARSGTVEEIEEHIAAGKPAMIYFSSAPVRADSVDAEQYGALRDFKTSLKARALFEEYANLAEFRTKLSRQLAQTIISQFRAEAIDGENGSAAGQIMGAKLAPAPTHPTPAISPQARELLIEASRDQQGVVMSLQTMDGYHLQTNGRGFGDGDARSAARWKSAVGELQDLNLVEDRAGDSEVFFLTDRGYRLSAELEQQDADVPSLQFGEWHAGSDSGYPTHAPVGVPSWISIRNAEVRRPQTAKNVSVQIEWMNDAGSTRFLVPSAEWFIRRGSPGKRTSEGWANSAEIEGGDEQSCVLLHTGDDGRLWVYKDGSQPVGVLDYGHWTATLLVLADNAQGFEGKLGFTLTRSGLFPDRPRAFLLGRVVPPRLRKSAGA